MTNTPDRVEFQLPPRRSTSERSGSRTPRDSPTQPPGRIPRIAVLMALALECDSLIRDGIAPNQATLARLGQVTRARMSQILTLIHLAPDLQETILFLPSAAAGRDPIRLAELLPIAREPDWSRQRDRWRKIAPGIIAETNCGSNDGRSFRE